MSEKQRDRIVKQHAIRETELRDSLLSYWKSRFNSHYQVATHYEKEDSITRIFSMVRIRQAGLCGTVRRRCSRIISALASPSSPHPTKRRRRPRRPRPRRRVRRAPRGSQRARAGRGAGCRRGCARRRRRPVYRAGQGR